jgi:hypothetical protein
MFGEKLRLGRLGQSAKGFPDTDALPFATHFVANGLPGDAQHPGNVGLAISRPEKFDFSVDSMFIHVDL